MNGWMSPRSPRAPRRRSTCWPSPPAPICNLDCTYCFFLSKEMLYPGSRFRMADDLLETYLRQLIEAHARAPEVAVAWQGGEPTMMGLDFFRRSVELAETLKRARPADRYTHPDERHAPGRRVGRVPRRERLPGGPLDRRAARDPRRLPRGQGRQAHLRPGDGGPRVAAARTASSGTPSPRSTPPTRTAAARSIGSSATTAGRGSCSSSPSSSAPRPSCCRSPTPGWGDKAKDRPLYVRWATWSRIARSPRSGYGRFLIDVFEEWVRRDIGEVYVQMFDVALANWVGEPPGLCVHSETCGQRAGPRAQRRPLLLRPLRRARLQAGQHRASMPMLDLVACRSSGSSAGTNATRCRSTAWTATCASRATAAAPRTASRTRPTASRACTTSAPATRRSSATSAPVDGRDGASCCARNGHRASSWRSTPPRTRSAAATIRAPAAAAASGSVATGREPGARRTRPPGHGDVHAVAARARLLRRRGRRHRQRARGRRHLHHVPYAHGGGALPHRREHHEHRGALPRVPGRHARAAGGPGGAAAAGLDLRRSRRAGRRDRGRAPAADQGEGVRDPGAVPDPGRHDPARHAGAAATLGQATDRVTAPHRQRAGAVGYRPGVRRLDLRGLFRRRPGDRAPRRPGLGGAGLPHARERHQAVHLLQRERQRRDSSSCSPARWRGQRRWSWRSGP